MSLGAVCYSSEFNFVQICCQHSIRSHVKAPGAHIGPIQVQTSVIALSLLVQTAAISGGGNAETLDVEGVLQI